MSARINLFCLLIALCWAVPSLAHPNADPASSRVTERLQVHGAVMRDLDLGLAELRAFPPQQLAELPLICQSGAHVGQLENFRGVRLRDVLEKAQSEAPAHNDVKKMVVIATASDGYAVVFSWSELFNSEIGEGVMVLFEKDGLPIPDDRGRIALVSSKDLRAGPRSVKWLQSIEVRKVVE